MKVQKERKSRQKTKLNDRLLVILDGTCPECKKDLEAKMYHNKKYLYCEECDKIKYVYD